MHDRVASHHRQTQGAFPASAELSGTAGVLVVIRSSPDSVLRRAGPPSDAEEWFHDR